MRNTLCRFLSGALCVTMLSSGIVFSAPATEVEAAGSKVKSVKVTNISSNEITLNKGEKKKLKVKVSTKKGISKKFKVKVNKKKVVKVVSKKKKSIKIKALKKGTAKITITSKANPKKKVVVKVNVVVPVNGVTIDKTTASVFTGEKVSLNATVTNSKASNKNLVWSSSNTAVATVDNAGNVTTLKEGTAVIKATAADGSGKSASCTVKVTDPNTIESLQPIGVHYLKVVLADAQALTKDNFNIKVKKFANGQYVNEFTMDHIVTYDNKTYFVFIEGTGFYEGEYVQVSVKGLTGNKDAVVKEFQYGDVVKEGTVTFEMFGSANEIFDEYTYIGMLQGYTSVEAKNLPENVYYETISEEGETYVEIYGYLETPGTYNFELVVADEMGAKITVKVNLNIIDENTLVAGAYAESEYTSTTSSYTIGYVWTVGGSGDYTYEFVGESYDLVWDDEDPSYFWGDLPIGTNIIKIKVTDVYNPELTTTFDYVIVVEKGNKISGTVNTPDGQPVAGAIIMLNRVDDNVYENADDYIFTDSTGAYEVSVPDGVYDLLVVCETLMNTSDMSFSFENDIKADTVINHVVNVYRVELVTEEDVDLSELGEWSDEELNYYGYSNVLYLPKGTYNLTNTIWGFMSEVIVTFNANVTESGQYPVDVEIINYEAQDIYAGDTVTVDLSEASSVYYKFVPEMTGEYYFYTMSENDPMLDIYNEEGIILESLDDSDEGYNVFGTFIFEEGKVYYFCLSSWMGNEPPFDFYLSEGEEVGPAYDLEAMEEIFTGNTTIEVISDVEQTLYKFIPDTTGFYSFYTTSEHDPYLNIYNIYGEQIASYDDEDEYNVNGEYFFEEGEVYIFGFGTYITDGDIYDFVMSEAE